MHVLLCRLQQPLELLLSLDAQSDRVGHSDARFCCVVDNFHSADKIFTLEIILMLFPLPRRLANHSESALVRSNSSHEGADTKSGRLVLSSNATASNDDWLGSVERSVRTVWHRSLLFLFCHTTAEEAEEHQRQLQYPT